MLVERIDSWMRGLFDIFVSPIGYLMDHTVDIHLLGQNIDVKCYFHMLLSFMQIICNLPRKPRYLQSGRSSLPILRLLRLHVRLDTRSQRSSHGLPHPLPVQIGCTGCFMLRISLPGGLRRSYPPEQRIRPGNPCLSLRYGQAPPVPHKSVDWVARPTIPGRLSRRSRGSSDHAWSRS